MAANSNTITFRRDNDQFFWTSKVFRGLNGSILICFDELDRYVIIPPHARYLHFTVVEKPKKDVLSIIKVKHNGYRFLPPASRLLGSAKWWLRNHLSDDENVMYQELYLKIEWS